MAGSGAPRQAREPYRLSPSGAARRAIASDRNPAIAIDRLNQRMGITWNTLPGGAVAERWVFGGIWDDAVILLVSENLADLDLAGYGPSAYVRDPDVTHSRISDSFVFGWRESLNPDGTGQTLKVVEYKEIGGVVTPAFSFVNQSVDPRFAEFGPPRLEGGWRNNGRTLAIWESDAGTAGFMENWGQAFDLAAVVDAPPAKTPREFAVRIAPNPFNPRTEIALALPISGRASVDVYDVRGRLVRNLVDEDLPAGTYSRTWDGFDDGGQRVSSGVYLVQVRHPSGQRVTKVALVE